MNGSIEVVMVATEATATDRRVAAQVANIKSPMPIDLTTKLSWSRAFPGHAPVAAYYRCCRRYIGAKNADTRAPTTSILPDAQWNVGGVRGRRAIPVVRRPRLGPGGRPDSTTKTFHEAQCVDVFNMWEICEASRSHTRVPPYNPSCRVAPAKCCGPPESRAIN